jgi:hypothetical protein
MLITDGTVLVRVGRPVGGEARVVDRGDVI